MVLEDYRRLAGALVDVAQQAGKAILAHYRSPISVELKADTSPVTAADRDAEAIILAGLARIEPGVPVVAEEAMAAGVGPTGAATGQDRFFLVDPLDGTKEFINQRDEFTVNIALIEQGRPVFGVVYAPALSRLYVTTGPDAAGEMDLDAGTEPVKNPIFRAIRARLPEPDGLIVVASRSHMNDETRDFISRYKVAGLKNAGSSLKFCLLARGEADLYPRLGPTMEWDTAAGHAVLLAAGGTVCKIDGSPLCYGNAARGYLNPFFVASGHRN